MQAGKGAGKGGPKRRRTLLVPAAPSEQKPPQAWEPRRAAAAAPTGTRPAWPGPAWPVNSASERGLSKMQVPFQAAGNAPRPVIAQALMSSQAMPRTPQVSMRMPPRLRPQPPNQAQPPPAAQAPSTSPALSQTPVPCHMSQAPASVSSSYHHEGLPPQAAPVAVSSAAGRVTDWPKQVFCSSTEYDWTFTKEIIRPDSAMILAISSLDKDLDGKGTVDLVRELGG